MSDFKKMMKALDEWLNGVSGEYDTALDQWLGEVRAEAWDEGYECGRDDEEFWTRTGQMHATLNPHRKAEHPGVNPSNSMGIEHEEKKK